MNIRLGDLQAAVQHGSWVHQRIGLANAADVKVWMMNLSPEAFAEFTRRLEQMSLGCAMIQRMIDSQTIKVD